MDILNTGDGERHKHGEKVGGIAPFVGVAIVDIVVKGHLSKLLGEYGDDIMRSSWPWRECSEVVILEYA
jgi:hypothetical protein